MSGKPAPVAYFRVYPNTRKYFYFTVQVFRTRAEMHAAALADGVAPYGLKRTEAFVQGSTRYKIDDHGRKRMRGCLGAIYFYAERLGVGLVSHECTHAALRYFERLGLTLTDQRERVRCSANEETLCHAVGQLAAQIYRRLFAKKVI